MASTKNFGYGFPYFSPPPPHYTPAPPKVAPPPPHHTPTPPPHFPGSPPPPHHTPTPPPQFPGSPSPPPPHHTPTPPPNHAPTPPPSHLAPPPPPHHIIPSPPPPPHVIPSPPSPGHHSTVIVVVFVSLGGLFFLAFLSVALCCFIKRRKKKTIHETDMVKVDEHVRVQEAIVPGPHGTEVVVLSIDEDVHVEEEVKKSETVGAMSHLKKPAKYHNQALDVASSISESTLQNINAKADHKST